MDGSESEAEAEADPCFGDEAADASTFALLGNHLGEARRGRAPKPAPKALVRVWAEQAAKAAARAAKALTAGSATRGSTTATTVPTTPPEAAPVPETRPVLPTSQQITQKTAGQAGAEGYGAASSSTARAEQLQRRLAMGHPEYRYLADFPIRDVEVLSDVPSTTYWDWPRRRWFIIVSIHLERMGPDECDGGCLVLTVA